jgi:hypothetical protein
MAVFAEESGEATYHSLKVKAARKRFMLARDEAAFLERRR